MAIAGYDYIPFFDLTAGINTVSSAIHLTPQECRDSQNIDYRPIGGITKRNGYEALNTSPIVAGAGVTGLFMARYSTAGGTNVAYMVAGDKLYSMPSTLNGTWTDKTNGLTITDNDDTPWSFSMMNDIVVLGNGTDASIQIDASSVATALTGAGGTMTKFLFPLEARGYMFYFVPTVSGTAYYDRCYFSDINAPATIGTNNFINIATGQGGGIGGAVEYKTYVYVFKRHGIYQLVYQPTRVSSSGVAFPWTEFPNPVVPGVGCTAHRSIVKFTTPVTHATPGQELVFFVDQFGIPRIFDGRTTISFNSKIGTSRDTSIKSLADMDTARTKYAHAVNYPSKDMLLFWLTQNNNKTDTPWVLDYSKGFAIGRYKYYWPFNCAALFEKSNGTFKPYAGNFEGQVFQLDSGTDDDGQPIEDYYVDGDTSNKNPFLKNTWYNLEVRGLSGSTSQSVRFSYYIDGEDTPTKADEISLSRSDTLWGSFIWGIGTWAKKGIHNRTLEINQYAKTLRVKVETVNKLTDTMIIEGYAKSAQVRGTSQVD